MMCLEPICVVWRHAMSSSERRRCLLVGEEDMLCLLLREEDVFLLEKNICCLDMIYDDMI